ncbi:hypothetical protein [Streptomyces sp. NPDC058295]|uniref:hypothetical protein n=1 Tax=Streptomyces sp. NPDC058295 TaxID=3346431 RepID=UPI0036E1136A
MLFVLVPAVGGITSMINGIADATPSTALIAGVATSGLALSAYTWLVRYLEGPRPQELSLAQARQGCAGGAPSVWACAPSPSHWSR